MDIHLQWLKDNIQPARVSVTERDTPTTAPPPVRWPWKTILPWSHLLCYLKQHWIYPVLVIWTLIFMRQWQPNSMLAKKISKAVFRVMVPDCRAFSEAGFVTMREGNEFGRVPIYLTVLMMTRMKASTTALAWQLNLTVKVRKQKQLQSVKGRRTMMNVITKKVWHAASGE